MLLIVLCWVLGLGMVKNNILAVDNKMIWPIRSEEITISSPFGPRLQASAGYRYDFHRGIDLQTPIGTPIYATEDGEIRLSGLYPYYDDMVVQIRHYKEPTASCSNENCYYTNYIHLSSTVVSEGDVVQRGDLIAYSGSSASGFAHLHFEVRDKGIYQKNCVNPYEFLSYKDSQNLKIEIEKTDFSDKYNPEIGIKVYSDRQELDFNRVKVTIIDALSTSKPRILGSNYFDANEWNWLYSDIYNLDNPDLNGILISPSVFNSVTLTYEIRFNFHQLPIKYRYKTPLIRVEATDVNGNTTLVTKMIERLKSLD